VSREALSAVASVLAINDSLAITHHVHANILLEPGIRVAVIAGTDDSVDRRRWWMSKAGIHVIARKTLPYLYAVSWPVPVNSPVSAQ